MSSLVRATTSLWRLGIIGILIAYPGAASAQPQYAITTLVDVPNVYSAWAHGINDNGQIVGGMKVLNDAPTWAWRQDGGTIVAALRQAVFLRPTLSGYMVVRYRPYSTVLDRTRVVHGGAAQPIRNPLLNGDERGVYGAAANEAGIVVGSVRDGLWSGPFAFAWQNGVTTLLEANGGLSSDAADVNDLGVIAGAIRPPQAWGLRPAIWQGGVPTLIGSFDGVSVAINNANQVIGNRYSDIGSFFWSDGIMTDNVCPAGLECRAVDLNESGQVLLGIQGAVDQAVIFHDGAWHSLGTLGAGVAMRPYALNDSGDAVGSSAPGGDYRNPRAFAYLKGVLHDLNDLVPSDSGWTRLGIALDINNHGQIVGVGLKDGRPQPFLLTPAE